jgi:hypothetical protein
VIAFNTAEGWSRDVSEDVSHRSFADVAPIRSADCRILWSRSWSDTNGPYSHVPTLFMSNGWSWFIAAGPSHGGTSICGAEFAAVQCK